MLRPLAALSLLVAFSVGAHAAVVTQVKGDQVMIDTQGDSSYTPGSRYLIMVGDKKKAVVEISKAKGSKALGKVLKGTAAVDGTLAPLPGGAAPSSSSKSASRSSRRRRGGAGQAMTYGAIVGYGSTWQSVTVTKAGTETVSMSGSSLSLKGFADLPVSGDFGIIGRVGFENFGVSGTSASLGAVETKILYLSADLLLRYKFMADSSFQPFPLLGMGLHYPLSKTSGVLDVQRISATTIFFLGGGFNYTLNPNMYLHATAEYGLFPPSNDVKTSLIAVRAGVGFTL